MANTKIHITTTRMLDLIDYIIESGKARTKGEACDLFGYNYANLSRITSGAHKFTVEQIEEACRVADASADYVFGFSNVISRKPPKKAIELLKQAVAAIEVELN